MSWRSRSRRWRSWALLCLFCSRSRARPRSAGIWTRTGPEPTSPTCVTVPSRGTFWTSGRCGSARSFRSGARGGLLSRRRLRRRRQVERAGLAGGPLPGRGNLGGLGQLPALNHAPFPAPMLDGARAIQFLAEGGRAGNRPRSDRGLGNSAGAGIALWVGFHDDLADPRNNDPVLRQSSRLACLGVVGAQTSYDPRFIKQLIGGRAHEHVALRPLFGVTSPAESDTPRIHRLYEEASPLNYVSSDDPPVILFYSEPNAPLPTLPVRQGIHHPRFGAALKAMLDPLGVECMLRHDDDYRGQEHPGQAMYGDLVGFFAKHLLQRNGASSKTRRTLIWLDPSSELWPQSVFFREGTSRCVR